MLKKKEIINLNTTCKNNPTKFANNFTLSEKGFRKKCLGCCDTFTYYQSKNFDYCKNCSINGSRYSQNKCSECGDGSGLIKFPNQPPRNCKLCYLARQEQREDKLTK